jgi:HemY protein
MLWSVLKVLLFLAIAAVLAWVASRIIATPGEVRIAFGGRELDLSPLGFIVAVLGLVVLALILLKLVGFLVALGRFLLGDETAISRYFSRSRERRGFDALADGMVAVAAGDPRTATRKAHRPRSS